MDPLLLAIIGVVVIVGPVVLALVLWANPDRRPWRRRAENAASTRMADSGDAVELGPSLRWATAITTRTTRDQDQ